MTEYIEREAVEKAILIKREQERQHWIEFLNRYRTTSDYSSKEQAVDNWLRGYGEAVENLLAIFETLPTADVVEVKHGEWHLLYNCANEGVYCSVCHKKVYKTDYANQKIKSPFCPNCGAKMDLREGAEE